MNTNRKNNGQMNNNNNNISGANCGAQTINGANCGAQTTNAAAALANEKREAIDAASRAAWNIKGLFGIEFSTIRKHIMAAERGERPLGVVAHGQYRCLNGHINIYVQVDETVEYGVKRHTTTIEAYRYEWKHCMGVETVKQTVEFWYNRNYEETFREVLGAVLVKYIVAWFDRREENMAAERGMTVEEWRAFEAANEKGAKLDSLEEALKASLDEAGWNALNLAYALAEAIQHTDGAVTPDNVEELALWRAYRGEIEKRLESLSNGGGNPAPGLDDETAGENDNDNDGHPAPGLEYPHTGEEYTTQVDGVTVRITGERMGDNGEWIVSGRLIGRDGPDADLTNVSGVLYYTDANGFSYRLKKRIGETTDNTPAPGLRDQIEEMLAADWDKMDETEDGYDIDYHRVDGYWLQTTADCDCDHSWMHVSLRLTPELEKKYVTDANELWELCWRIERDADIEMVAGKIADAMITAPQYFFREGADYKGDDGYTYTLCAVNWDEGRNRYIVDVENEYGDPYTGVMDAEATAVTVYGDDDSVMAMFHAEDVIE